MKEITVYAPATVANLNCGFDVLGLAIDGPGDTITLRKVKKRGITITKIEGAELPMEATKNVAGVAGIAMLDYLKADFGFEIDIVKGIPIGSGIGGSAASAAAMVYGINQFLAEPLSTQQLAFFGMKGEALASGNEHADNVAPALFGGITLIPGYHPFEVIELPVPPQLYVTVVHPHIEINTKAAREILPKQVRLKDAIVQAGNLAGLVAGFYSQNFQLIASSLKDVLIEPHRKQLLPYFDAAKTTALEQGALGFGISGSGPSMFALSEGKNTAEKLRTQLVELYSRQNVEIDSFASPINAEGAKIISV
ncbi:MAG: homoserine kinase [Flavobacteriales bacterium]|jgi:homoserine kinase|uniref:homoserine kinase n=1 Tax=Candidatus Ulvibacter alkanivorans TaxID=2267620 RepID=UPI000DF191A4|nr:homoserine kinase [Candidatus Ulvibacter alkanivorans]MCH2489119.1 homoserine kinase [Flavobacteriales bacterium]